jgi:hypothetical protein
VFQNVQGGYVEITDVEGYVELVFYQVLVIFRDNVYVYKIVKEKNVEVMDAMGNVVFANHRKPV